MGLSDWVNYFEKTNRSILLQCETSRRLIELIIENTLEDGLILEAGCGSALLSLLLADYGFNVTALDFDKNVVSYAKSRMCLNSNKLNFIQGDIFKLSQSFKGKFFDTLCHSGVMEHFGNDDIVKSLAEQRIISKKVIFSVPNNRNKLTDKHFGDERFLSNRKWVSLIKRAGFNRVKVFGGYDLSLSRYIYLILPGIFFRRKGSFWWQYFSRHSIFICENE
jgi:2-polyprenyl-3-methyl-5-hydroxy-6-metoxy-1,4-benzoquinol methylase